MRRIFIVPILLVFLVGCTSETPWRKATVSTYELLGAGIGAGHDMAVSLHAQGVISEVQMAKINEMGKKANVAFIAAGKTLKLAGQATTIAQRDATLEEYSKLLADFAALSAQLYDLIKNFKKVSYNEVLEMVMNGGELWE